MNPCLRVSNSLVLSCLLLALALPAHAGWKDFIDIFSGEDSGVSDVSLSNTEIINGLKAALRKGADSAVDRLGRPDGFFGNPRVRIPMPPALQNVESALRTIGQDRLADEFVLTMNRAAEQAVPEAAGIFADAIRNMSIADARGILNGPDDAATSYLRGTSSDRLREKMLPIVAAATDRAGVTARYKSMTDNLGFAAGMLDVESLDLDRYVTDRAVDGVFTLIAEEEKRIREDPVARTSEILKRVFN